MKCQPEAHASDESIERYALGRLPAAEEAAFEEHLLICPECQDRLAECDAFIRATRLAAADLADRLPATAPPASGLVWLWRPAPLLVACAVLVLAMWAGMRLFTPGLEQPAALAVALEATRGDTASAPAGVPLLLKLDVSGLPDLESYVVRIVTETGEPALEAPGQRSGNTIRIAVAGPLEAGGYWVRVYNRAPTLLREYGLRVTPGPR